MKSKILAMTLLSLGLAGTFVLGGCGNTENGASNAPKSKVVTDLTGRKVEVPQDPKRIAIVPIPWMSVVYSVQGNGNNIVGMNPSAMAAYKKSILSKMDPKLANVNTSFVDNKFNINYEEVANLKPDLMIVWDYQNDAIKKLEEMHIPTVAIKYGTLEDIQNGMKLVGELTNSEKQASELIKYHKDNEAYFKSKEPAISKVNKPKVLYVRDETLAVAANKSVNQIMINMAGGENAASGVNGQWAKVSMDQVINWNPDVIILSNFSNIMPDDLYNNKLPGQDWSQISAVKNHRVYKAPMGIYRWDAPCVETPLMMRWLGKVLQPAIFNDYNERTLISDFYKTYYHYNLSEEELNSILNTNVNSNLSLK